MFHFHREKTDTDHFAALSGELESLRDEGGDIWEKYWFCIEGKTLNWYNNTRRAHKIGSFDLKSLHKIEHLHDGSYRAFLFNADRDLAIKARSLHELDMWLRAIELYADLSRGGDGTGIVNVPEPIESFRKRMHSGEEAELDAMDSPSATESNKLIYYADRSPVKDHGHTLVRHADQDYGPEDIAEAKDIDRVAIHSKLAAHPFSFRNNGSEKLGSFTEYDDKHHLVTHHNVDTGVTTFNKSGIMHTNFYF